MPLDTMPMQWKFLSKGDQVMVPLKERKKTKFYGPWTVMDVAARTIEAGFGIIVQHAMDNLSIPTNDERVDLGLYETFLIT